MQLEQINAIVEAQKSPYSGVVMLRRGNETVFEQAYGFANRAEALPNRMDTRFATASGCKVFTAVAVLQLIEQGKFTLDTPLVDVLDVPLALDDITVRHLLTHTSGLFDYYDEEDLSDEDCLAIWEQFPVYTLRQPEDYLPLMTGHPPKFAPGERFHYNNGAFVLLALLVKQQSDLDFPDYVQQNIFDKVGMAESGYFQLNQLPGNVATGYIEEDSGSWRSNIYLLPVIGSGDGGAYVSAGDWAKFWDALYGHKLLSPSMTEAMLTPQVETGHKTLDQWYGYGIWIVKREGEIYERFVMGGDFGVGMVSIVFPGYDVQLTMLDNTGDGVWSLWGAIVKALDEALDNNL